MLTINDLDACRGYQKRALSVAIARLEHWEDQPSSAMPCSSSASRHCSRAAGYNAARSGVHNPARCRAL